MTLTKTIQISDGITLQKYTSDYYTTDVELIDGILRTADSFPRKYMLPTIKASVQENTHEIFLEYNMPIPHERFQEMREKTNLAEQFIQNELLPLLQTLQTKEETS